MNIKPLFIFPSLHVMGMGTELALKTILKRATASITFVSSKYCYTQQESGTKFIRQADRWEHGFIFHHYKLLESKQYTTLLVSVQFLYTVSLNKYEINLPNFLGQLISYLSLARGISLQVVKLEEQSGEVFTI